MTFPFYRLIKIVCHPLMTSVIILHYYYIIAAESEFIYRSKNCIIDCFPEGFDLYFISNEILTFYSNRQRKRSDDLCNYSVVKVFFFPIESAVTPL